jgi:hypothetical protein
MAVTSASDRISQRVKQMPKFLEKKLKAQYGADSDVPYKIMNAKGFMHGSKVTAKGKAAEKKHKADNVHDNDGHDVAYEAECEQSDGNQTDNPSDKLAAQPVVDRTAAENPVILRKSAHAAGPHDVEDPRTPDDPVTARKKNQLAAARKAVSELASGKRPKNYTRGKD